jgi:heat shock protein HspQ
MDTTTTGGTMAFQIGDYVRGTDYGIRGRVTRLHDRCPEDQEWIDLQEIPVTDVVDEPWIDVLVHGGGAVHLPVSRALKIEPFDFANFAENGRFD